MTVKNISGTTITTGYVLSATYSALHIYKGAAVEGVNGPAGAYGVNVGTPGAMGGIGVLLNDAALVQEYGTVEGGHGGAGGATNTTTSTHTATGGVGGEGDYGIWFADGGTLAVKGVVSGGFGGAGGKGRYGGNGGSGAAGLVASTAAVKALVMSGGTIVGGAGGQGGGGADYYSGYGGSGGEGIALSAGGFVGNYHGLIEGGQGGAGGASPYGIGRAGGAGGDGVALMTVQATIISFSGGTIVGGTGGVGGAGSDAAGVGGSGGAAIYVEDGGSITNYALIAGGVGGVGGAGDNGGAGAKGGAGGAGIDLKSGVVTNFGTISGGAGGGGGTGSANGAAGFRGDGIDLYPAGADRVINQVGALIVGYFGIDAIATGPATITNFGTIEGDAPLATASILMDSGSDRLIVESGSSFIGGVYCTHGGTLELAGGADTISRLGAATYLGTLTGASAMVFFGFSDFVTDSATQLTLAGVDDLSAGQSLTNNGTLLLAGSLTNAGDIGGGMGTTGVTGTLGGRGSTGDTAIAVNNGVLINSAAITGGVGGNGAAGGAENGGEGGIGGTALYVGYGGRATNTGTIKGGAGGAGGTGATAGPTGYMGIAVTIYSATSSSLTNGSSTVTNALIEGYYGVYASPGGAATVTNFGTIEGVGPTAVSFKSASDRLVVEASADFIGQVSGGGGTLEIACSNTLQGLGGAGTLVNTAGTMSFSHFGTYVIDAGHKTTLYGSNTLTASKNLVVDGGLALSAGAVLAGYGAATLANSGTITGGGVIYGTMALTNAAGGVIDDNAGAMLINNQYGAGLTNNGVIESAAGATLSLKGVLLDGNGTTEAFGTIKLIGDNLSSSSLNVESGGVLLVTSSGDNFGSALDISNAGSIRINSGGTLFTGANISGAGSVAIDGASGADAVITARGDVTFSGGGTVSLNADGFIYGSASDGLTNADTITGGGTISSQMTITNAAGGVIDGDAGDMLIDNQAGSGLNNDGLIESAVGDSLTLANALMSGTGATEAFGTIKLDGDNIESGSLSVESGGLLQVTSSGSNIGPGVDISNAGSIKVSGGGNLYASSDISGAGSIALDGASGADADLGIRGDVTLSGGGTVSMNAEGVIFGYGISFTNADIITGGGAIFGSMTVTNSGAIDDDAGTMLINNQNGGGLINTGTIESTATGILSLKNVTVTGSGIITDDHQMKLEAAVINGGAITIGASALFEVIAGTSSLSSAVSLTNDKTLEVITGGKLTIAGSVTNNGLMETVGTGVLVLSGAVTGTGSARLFGSGSLTINGSMSQGVAFAGTDTGNLILGAASDFTGVISGFSKTGANAIDLKGVAYNAGDTAVFSGKTATLTLYDASNAVLATLKLKGNYNGSTFVLSNDGSGGTLVKDPPASVPMAQAMAGFSGASASGAHATPSPATLQPLPLAVHG